METVFAAIPVSLAGLACAVLFWTSLLYIGRVISPVVAPRLYSCLTPREKAEWDTLVVAFVHAVSSFLVRSHFRKKTYYILKFCL